MMMLDDMESLAQNAPLGFEAGQVKTPVDELLRIVRIKVPPEHKKTTY
jgi:hypothetical protein